MCDLTEVTSTTQNGLHLDSYWSGASRPSCPSRPKLSRVYGVSSTWNEAAATHTQIRKQMQEVCYQVIQPPSWENKGPTNGLCSGHKGAASQSHHSAAQQTAHTHGPFVSYKDGLTQPNFRPFLVSKLRTITKEPQLMSFLLTSSNNDFMVLTYCCTSSKEIFILFLTYCCISRKINICIKAWW